MPKIDHGTINFAVYEDATEFFGLAEVTLPELSSITEEIKGAGIAGNLNVSFMGHWEAMSMTLNFRTVQPSAIRLLRPGDHTLDLRAAQQLKDTTAGSKLTVQRIKHIVVCTSTKFAPGKLAPASPGEASGEYSVSYLATYIDGKKHTEIDIQGFICEIDGIDYLAEARAALGK